MCEGCHHLDTELLCYRLHHAGLHGGGRANHGRVSYRCRQQVADASSNLTIVTLCRYFYVQRVYKLAALQFKRLDSTTRSPIYNQFSESLGGLATIRAYGVEPICADKNSAIVNTNTRSQFTQKMVERW